jgi:hypothetical protein
MPGTVHIKSKGVRNLGYATEGRYLRAHRCRSTMSACACVCVCVYLHTCMSGAGGCNAGRAYCNVSLTLTATAPRRIKQLRVGIQEPPG